jgi:pimeloyl-ACP methyl ester carboxylesterase
LTTDISISRRNEITRDGYRLAPLLVQAWISFKSSQEDLRLMVKSINCPVLFTWGIKDKFVKFGRNKNAINQFKNYKLIKYEIGHTPYIECPDLFLKDFQEFLKNNDK